MSAIPKKPRKVNYLNNKDILKEIHTSKNSYCSFVDPEYHRYDIIIDMPESPLHTCFEYALKPEQVQRAKETRAIRLTQETGEKVLPDSILTTDLIFRIMTWDHIPMSQKQPRKTTKKKTAKDIFVFEDDDDDIFSDLEDKTTKKDVDDMVHEKVNFPPFQHYKLDENNTFRCVGKSHWEGGMDNGHFNKDHGNITNKLARMYMMLCEKYSMKFNWRGYTYRDEMEASAILQLTYVGLRFNEAKSSNPFAYYTAAVNNSFCRVLNTEKRSQNIRDDILEMNGLSPSFSRQMKGNKLGQGLADK
jgi:hypothetical protein